MKLAVIAACGGLAAVMIAGSILWDWRYVLGMVTGVAVERLGSYSERVLFPAEHEQGHR